MRAFFAGIFLTIVSSVVAAPASLDAWLDGIRTEYHVPGIAAVFIAHGEIVAQGAAGVRKEGSPELVTIDDKFHIGSCTKSMTATLAAMMVEEGNLRWDMTLAEGLPMLAKQMDPAWTTVTISQLLSHEGGAPTDLDQNGLWGRLWQNNGQPGRTQRLLLARELTSKTKPVAAPGTQFIYSNAGIALVG